jgi:hypothetical protein
MLTVSHAASELLDQWLSSVDEAPEDAVIRLVAKDDEIGFAIDTVQPGDETFAHAEKTVLAIDEQISRLLANKKLDVEVTGDQPELTLMEHQQV